MGSEVRAEEASDNGERSTTEAKMGETERAKLRERQAAIEADLEKACQEEDYDKAGLIHALHQMWLSSFNN